MDRTAYELGKQAAATISRSVTVKVNSPGGTKKLKDALNAKKHSNSDGPWQKGRKRPK